MLGENRISSEELTSEKSNSNQELLNEKIIENNVSFNYCNPGNSNQEITSNYNEEEITIEDNEEKPYTKRVTRKSKQEEEDSEYQTPTSKVGTTSKRSSKYTINTKTKKTKINPEIEQENNIKAIADSLLQEISLAFQTKIENEAIQKKENSSIMLASDTRNTKTLTRYATNPTNVDINQIVDEEILIQLEVSELEQKHQNAAFNYYFKLYEWSQRKDQQISWLYNNPISAKNLFDIDIDSNCSIEDSKKKVKK